jgi:two-component system OmpR family response regulator
MTAAISTPQHILLVEDDREVRSFLSTCLQKNGYRATAVAEGRSMRRVLEQTRVDLIVLDRALPAGSGPKLCREVRARSPMPILMLTATSDAADRIVEADAGTVAYMRKPFTPGEFVRRVKALLAPR